MNAPSNRFLIVNADDFGLSEGVNRGIAEAHERGIVTSASLMVRWPAAKEAAAYAVAHRRLSAGLHVDLGEWRYRDGQWVPLYEVVRLHDPAEVESEITRQLNTFQDLTGMLPTHLDSHQHVHQREPARSVLVSAGHKHGIPVRHFASGIRYCGEFYGQSGEGEPAHEAITVEALLGILDRLRPGCTELACHPASTPDLDTMYREERPAELRILCDPRIKAATVERNITLCNFRQIQSKPDTKDACS